MLCSLDWEKFELIDSGQSLLAEAWLASLFTQLLPSVWCLVRRPFVYWWWNKLVGKESQRKTSYLEAENSKLAARV